MSRLTFPLYDSLLEKSETMQDIPDVWKYIPNLPAEHLEMIYALIYHHSLKDPAQKFTKKCITPYKSKVFDTGKGVIFQVNLLPFVLQRVISTYVMDSVDVV
jgi:hypothetical protein